MSEKDNRSWRDKLEVAIRKNLLTWLVGFLLFGVLIAFVVGLSYFIKFHGAFSDRQDVWGQFGDFVGGSLNPLFAFLSFVALLMTLVIQNRELENSYDELKKSTNALNQQSRALDLQNFERTFFELIRLHHELVNGVAIHNSLTRFTGDDIRTEHTKYEGRECFTRFYSILSGNYHRVLEGVDHSQSLQSRIEEAYEDFIRHEKTSIGHYFRNLYHVFKFVDESGVNNKQWYASIVRAQLSNPELCLLFYNALMPQHLKSKILIEKYAVLENMNVSELLDKEQHMPLYEDSAYGDQVAAQQS